MDTTDDGAGDVGGAYLPQLLDPDGVAVDEVAQRLPDHVPLTAVVPPLLRESPLVHIDFELQDGFEVVPCPHCAGWFAEVVPLHRDREILREWHAAACPELEEWR